MLCRCSHTSAKGFWYERCSGGFAANNLHLLLHGIRSHLRIFGRSLQSQMDYDHWFGGVVCSCAVRKFRSWPCQSFILFILCHLQLLWLLCSILSYFFCCVALLELARHRIPQWLPRWSPICLRADIEVVHSCCFISLFQLAGVCTCCWSFVALSILWWLQWSWLYRGFQCGEHCAFVALGCACDSVAGHCLLIAHCGAGCGNQKEAPLIITPFSNKPASLKISENWPRCETPMQSVLHMDMMGVLAVRMCLALLVSQLWRLSPVRWLGGHQPRSNTLGPCAIIMCTRQTTKKQRQYFIWIALFWW